MKARLCKKGREAGRSRRKGRRRNVGRRKRTRRKLRIRVRTNKRDTILMGVKVQVKARAKAGATQRI